MNKELILMLVLSFVVGYIVSEVVRKCGCNIVEGATTTGNDIDDPNTNPDIQPTDIYGNPKCTGTNLPRDHCPGGRWEPYYSPGASGVKDMACRYACVVDRKVDGDGTVIATTEQGDKLPIMYACSEEKPAIPFDKWDNGKGCNPDSS